VRSGKEESMKEKKIKEQGEKEQKMAVNESLDFLEVEGKMVEALKKVYDPEIPVNVYDLGLIYELEYTENREANINMTLTAPNCPVVDILLMDVENAVSALEEVDKVNVNLVFDPPWDKSMLSEEAKLELGLL
jgi:FeS assembly SUF system protein